MFELFLYGNYHPRFISRIVVGGVLYVSEIQIVRSHLESGVYASSQKIHSHSHRHNTIPLSLPPVLEGVGFASYVCTLSLPFSYGIAPPVS